MNQITRSEADKLIERLVDKTVTYATLHSHDNGNTCYTKPIGHPIMLTDVLEKIKNFHTEPEKAPEHIGCLMDTDNACCDLMRVWWNSGFKSSLQTILAEAEWEKLPIKPCDHMSNNRKCKLCPTSVMKGPAVELFEYLISLFPKTSE